MRIRPDILFSPDTLENSIVGTIAKFQDIVRATHGFDGFRVHLVENNTSHWVNVSWEKDSGRMVSLLVTSVSHETNQMSPLNFIFK